MYTCMHVGVYMLRRTQLSSLFRSAQWPLKALSKIPPCNNKVATMQKQADPMVYHGRMRARWGYEMLQALRRTDTGQSKLKQLPMRYCFSPLAVRLCMCFTLPDEVLSKFTAPLLLIHGKEDHISTVESSR